MSQIVAGNLTGSCDTITDYVINWYGPNSTTEVGYVSGFGSEFNYQFPHPLTGTSAIFAQAGTYIPVVDKVIISGYTFSQTGGTGFYMANLDCFGPITVEALKCNNGNTIGNYSHVYQFSGATSGELPQPLSVSFELSSNTKFFPFEFKAFSVTDNLKITLNSVNYPTPIALEWVTVGFESPYNISYTSFPREIKNATNFISKVLTLTGFTISNGDYLTIEITPNTGNSQTNWVFGCNCNTTFDCSTCLDNYSSSPYPILSGSITTSLISCNRINIGVDISGCTLNEINSMDITKYIGSFSPSNYYGVETDNTTKKRNLPFNGLYWSNVSCSPGGGYSGNQCSPVNTNSITYEKKIVGGIGDITITCSSYSDFSAFYNAYLNVLTYSGTPSNPFNADYYRSFVLFIPTPLTNNCGDGTTIQLYPIHYSSIVTTGGTGPWFINLTMPTMQKELTFTSCDLNCQSSIDGIVLNVNNSSTGTSNNISGTTVTGSRTTSPFSTYYYFYSASTSATTTQWGGYYEIPKWQTETIGWTGNTNTYIPSTSGQTCLFNNWYSYGNSYRKFVYYYQLRLTNPSNVSDFEIWGSPINNNVYSGFPSSIIYELALQYSGGSITYANPYYVK